MLVGSKWGVIGDTLDFYRARHGGVRPITRSVMEALTKEEAILVGLDIFYEMAGYSKLVWNRVAMSALDKGWGSGPVIGIKLLQRVVGAHVDGIISEGGETATKFAAFIAQHGEEHAAQLLGTARLALDAEQAADQPYYLNAWQRRTRSFQPDTAWWGSAKR